MRENNNEFIKDISMKSLAELLCVHHEYKDSFILSESAHITYHPCFGYNSNYDISGCTRFSLHERTYKNILCSLCQSKRSDELRKKIELSLHQLKLDHSLI